MTMPGSVADLLGRPVYGGYQYAYPHKTAYRHLPRPVPLREAWAQEGKDALFLYLHVPFCEMRCGFCNLFTLTHGEALVAPYLEALRRQAVAVAEALGCFSIARLAIGGGTPTFLSADRLEALFDVAESCFGAMPTRIPTSVETSPATATPDRLATLKRRGVARISIGIESFSEDEAKAIGRPQSRGTVDAALGAIRAENFATLNVDLIYGGPGQTPARFLASVRAALAWRPEEIYLYPLYVRPLTGLGRRDAPEDERSWDARRLAIYRSARDHLLAAGYHQVSMRLFRRPGQADRGSPYNCTQDGMIGLGAGARSYAGALHYSSEYAVGRTGVRAIVDTFIGRGRDDFLAADYGIHLDVEDRRRRFVLMSLLQDTGLPLGAYAERFGASAYEHLPQLGTLELAGLATQIGDALVLNEAGLERSDAIGPWLQGAAVKARMQGFALR